MKVNIRKGTNQIGGCMTEISTNQARILIDFGRELSSISSPLEEPIAIEGLTDGKPIYDAVFITHSHEDHIGLVEYIQEEIPVYVEPYASTIYHLTGDFMGKERIRRTVTDFSYGEAITIQNLKITPYLVDHSSFHSTMFLVEGDGKRVLHTGDYRSHGRTGKSFRKTLEQIGEVDCLITEGTTFSREDVSAQKEESLQEEAISIFKQYEDILILQSSTNIDRLVSFYKAARKTKKNFIEDLWTAQITSHLPASIPSPNRHYAQLSVWISPRYYRKPESFQEKYVKPLEQYRSNLAFHQPVCMMVKQSMLKDIQFLYHKKHKFHHACLIYSMWDGYQEDEKMKEFLQEIENMGIPVLPLHTSGHADRKTMKLLNEIVKPKITIPIHTTKKENAHKFFQNVYLPQDGEEIKI